MAEMYKARLVHHEGPLPVTLPDDFGLVEDEVYVSRDENTGDVTLSRQPWHNAWREIFAFMDSLDIPQADLGAYMDERPMNT